MEKNNPNSAIDHDKMKVEQSMGFYADGTRLHTLSQLNQLLELRTNAAKQKLTIDGEVAPYIQRINQQIIELLALY